MEVPPQFERISPIGICSASDKALPKNQHTADVAFHSPLPIVSGVAKDHGSVAFAPSSLNGVTDVTLCPTVMVRMEGYAAAAAISAVAFHGGISEICLRVNC